MKGILKILCKVTLWAVFLIYVVVPVIAYFFPILQTKFIFFFLYKCPMFSNFTDFPLFGLSKNGSRNFYLKNGKTTLGVWHILPKSSIPEEKLSDDNFESLLNNGKPVILYFHGNALNRGGHHMVDLYKVLQKLDYHIVAIDYRGYGDSSGIPYTEKEVISDAMTAVSYVQSKMKSMSFYIWGHSLGSGVASHVGKLLAQQNKHPLGIVLEASFNKIADAARNHPLGKIYGFMPYFEYLFIDNIKRNEIYFDSEMNLQSVKSPILFLHAEDDHMVPYFLGKKLYDSVRFHDRNKDVEFHTFPAGHGYLHKHIWKAPNFPTVIRNFFKKTSKK